MKRIFFFSYLLVSLFLFGVLLPSLFAEQDRIPVAVNVSTDEKLIGSEKSDKNVDRKAVTQKAFRMQIPFIANDGQIDEKVSFYAKTFGGTVFVTKEGGIVYSLTGNKSSELEVSGSEIRESKIKGIKKETKGIALKETLIGGKVNVIKGEGESITKVSYFKGSDPSKWKSNISTYDIANLGDVYEGIELKLKAYGKNVEKLFYVKPDAGPEKIKIKIEGAKGLRTDEKGELIADTALGEIRFTRPIAYQEIEGKKVEVAVAYTIFQSEISNPQFAYGFAVESYDKRHPLIIDPAISYATYIGGFSTDWESGIAVDSSGNAYITGSTCSSDFPTTPGTYDTTYSGSCNDMFVLKLNATGSALLYSTFIGGGGGGSSIAVDLSGNAYVTGRASSSFPTTKWAYDITNNGGYDAFVLKLNATGSALLYSTFIGGSGDDIGNGIALSANEVFVTGQTNSSNFPTTPGAGDTTHNGGYDVFVLHLNATGSALLYSTFIGGSGDDEGYGIAVVDGLFDAYVTGYTKSTNFPITPGAYDSTYGGYNEAFVLRLNSLGNILVFSTFIGGSGADYASSIALVGASGYPDAIVTGSTNSSDFPVYAVGGYDQTWNGGYDVFVFSVSSNGLVKYSTFIGGSGDDHGYGVDVDSDGNAYVTGSTNSTNFPTTPGAYDTTFNGGSEDAFLLKLNNMCSILLYSTFIGGGASDVGGAIALDVYGNAYIAGSTMSSNFPTTPGAYDRYWHGYQDVFVAMFEFALPDLIVQSITTSPISPAPGQTVNVTVTVKNQGGGAAGSFYIDFYKQRDTTPAPYNNGDFTCDKSGLAAWATDTCTGTVTYASAGTYKMWAQIDTDQEVAESNETNNILGPQSITVVAQTLKPDLIISALTVPAKAGAGQIIQVTDTTKNSGTGTAPASSTCFYLSINGGFDAGDVQMYCRTVRSLAAGGDYETATSSVTIPAGTAAGTYYIIAKADATEAITESNDNNNVKDLQIKIGPDLIVSSIVTNPTSPLAGQDVNVTVTLKNQGGGAAGAFRVDIYKHLASAPSPGQAGDAYCTIASLAAGATTTCVRTVNYASGGSNTMWSQVDTMQQVPETNETNNTKSKLLTVKTPMPDLIILSIATTPFSPLAGQNVNVTVTVKNQGTGNTASNFWVDIYKHRASAPSPGQYGDAYCTIPAGLAAGATAICERTVSYATGGTYTMWALADSGGQVAESLETNNTKSKSITVQTPKPDLIVSALTVPAKGGAGQVIIVSDTIKNQGAGASVSSITRFYLSTNSSWDTGDTAFCQSPNVPALASGASSEPIDTYCKIPDGTVTGTYYIIAKADANGAITETNENNNTRSDSIKIGPDLIVSSIVTSPAAPLAGQNTTVTVTVKNLGGGAADWFWVDIYKHEVTAPSPGHYGEAYCTISGLAAGATATCVRTVNYSAAGTYTMWSLVDSGGRITETNETNNTKSKSIIVK